jgi:hypothetical protein
VSFPRAVMSILAVAKCRAPEAGAQAETFSVRLSFPLDPACVSNRAKMVLNSEGTV